MLSSRGRSPSALAGKDEASPFPAGDAVGVADFGAVASGTARRAPAAGRERVRGVNAREAAPHEEIASREVRIVVVVLPLWLQEPTRVVTSASFRRTLACKLRLTCSHQPGRLQGWARSRDRSSARLSPMYRLVLEHACCPRTTICTRVGSGPASTARRMR